VAALAGPVGVVFKALEVPSARRPECQITKSRPPIASATDGHASPVRYNRTLFLIGLLFECRVKEPSIAVILIV
jgi:hypothetical protein